MLRVGLPIGEFGHIRAVEGVQRYSAPDISRVPSRQVSGEKKEAAPLPNVLVGLPRELLCRIGVGLTGGGGGGNWHG